MKENILEVLMYLFENHMKDNCDIQTDEEILVDELKEAGFGSEEINRAFDWLEGLAQSTLAADRMDYVNNHSFRVLAPQETVKVNKDCWGFLLFLEQAQILDAYSREIVLDRLMALDPELIDLHQVRWVTLMVLFNQPDAKLALKEMEKLVLAHTADTMH